MNNWSLSLSVAKLKTWSGLDITCAVGLTWYYTAELRYISVLMLTLYGRLSLLSTGGLSSFSYQI
jgi:hypothetical protein